MAGLCFYGKWAQFNTINVKTVCGKVKKQFKEFTHLSKT